MTYRFKQIASPVGILMLVAKDEQLTAILWEHERPNRVTLGEMIADDGHSILCITERQLNEYFSGQRTTFDLPLTFQGTPFQQQVWQALLTIPYGETRSYSDIAHQIGNPKAVRAVGAANGRNPISIIAPCHRVIGRSGELTGFAGGIAAKAKLLQLEMGGNLKQPTQAGKKTHLAQLSPQQGWLFESSVSD